MEGKRGQHTNSKQLGKCLKGDFDFSLPFFQGLALLAPLCAAPQPFPVPEHQAGSPWAQAKQVALDARSTLPKLAPKPSTCLSAWLFPHVYCSSASLPCQQGVYCCASKTGAVGHAFHPVAACWINGAGVCARFPSSLSISCSTL